MVAELSSSTTGMTLISDFRLSATISRTKRTGSLGDDTARTLNLINDREPRQIIADMGPLGRVATSVGYWETPSVWRGNGHGCTLVHASIVLTSQYKFLGKQSGVAIDIIVAKLPSTTTPMTGIGSELDSDSGLSATISRTKRTGSLGDDNTLTLNLINDSVTWHQIAIRYIIADSLCLDF